MILLPTNRAKAFNVIFFEFMLVFVFSTVIATAVDMFIVEIGDYREGFIILALFIYLVYAFMRWTSNDISK